MQDTLQLLKDKNAAFSLMASVLLDFGKIYSYGNWTSDLLGLLPEIVNYQKINIEAFALLGRLSSKDLVIMNEPSVDELWRLAAISSAQVLIIAERPTDLSFVDGCVSKAEFRSAMISLGQHGSQILGAQEALSFFDDAKVPALFLDRDGVVIDHVDYIQNPDQVKLAPGIVECIQQARAKSWQVVIVTNQSGIGRGFYGWQEYGAVNQRMQELLAKQGAFVEAVYEAPFYTLSENFSGLVRRSLRKPRSGMLIQAAMDMGIQLRKSILIGDRATDMMAAAQAGLHKAFLLRSSVIDEELKIWNNWPLRSRCLWGGDLPIINGLQEFNFQEAGL